MDLDALEKIFHQSFHGKMHLLEQNLLQLQFMIQMHQQEVAGGIGWLLIFQKIKLHWKRLGLLKPQ